MLKLAIGLIPLNSYPFHSFLVFLSILISKDDVDSVYLGKMFLLSSILLHVLPSRVPEELGRDGGRLQIPRAVWWLVSGVRIKLEEVSDPDRYIFL